MRLYFHPLPLFIQNNKSKSMFSFAVDKSRDGENDIESHAECATKPNIPFVCAAKITKTDDFSKLRLGAIFIQLYRRTCFNTDDVSSKSLKTIQNNIAKAVFTYIIQKKTLLMMQNYDMSEISLSYDNVFNFLRQFKNCRIINRLYCIHMEKELSQKELEIKNLHSVIKIYKLKELIAKLKDEQNLQIINGGKYENLKNDGWEITSVIEVASDNNIHHYIYRIEDEANDDFNKISPHCATHTRSLFS